MYVVFGIASIAGWIINIVVIVHMMAAPITGMFAVRCIGVIVAPLGAVLGYL